MKNIFITLLLITSLIHAEQPTAFETAVQNVYAKHPHLLHLKQRVERKNKKGKKQQKKCRTAAINKLVDIAAVIYIMTKSYHRYYEIYGEEQLSANALKESFVWKVAEKLPGVGLFSYLKKMNKHALFSLDVAGTALEAVLAKSLVKFLIFCSTNNITEVLSETILQIKDILSSTFC